MTELRATLRLQFHSGFRFENAITLIPYFVQLGISHIYASPILKARPGSTYGYDMVDPTCVNPELGGEEGLRQLAAALQREQIGLIVDFVPNHMAVGGSSNPWWLSVLEWGQYSPYARFFDINWKSPDPLLKGQLLVPFLRTDYGEVLTAGELPLKFSPATGTFYFEHFDHRFPVYPPTYAEILAYSKSSDLKNIARQFKAVEQRQDYLAAAQQLQHELHLLAQHEPIINAIENAIACFTVPAQSNSQQTNDETNTEQSAGYSKEVERLHQLLERQPYRLASWRTAADDINWRRFFDVNELGALRTERAYVFEAIHEKIFELIEQGIISGLRIDHVDGLANPRAYCRKLRRRVSRIAPTPNKFVIYVEKILAENEQLPRDWLVDGTTGYEFMNQVSLLQHDPLGALQLRGLWQELTNRTASFKEEVLEARRLILSTSLAGDLESLAQQLLLVARTDIATRDLTLGAIRRAVSELIVHFTVYRTYSGACARNAQEQSVFAEALAGAKTTLQESDWPLLDHLDSWLGGHALHELPPGPTRRLRRVTLAHFQQITSPTAAKAVEDTACYRSAVLLSRNDVGFDPARFSINIAQFHQQMTERADSFPGNLLATATHDHKRGEDTRARLAVISERSVWFAGKVNEWRSYAQHWRTELEDGPAPSAGDELALYQTLLGSWPFDLDPEDKEGMKAYLERVLGWQEKATREAKLRTRWISPNQAYEAACRDFLTNLLLAEETRSWRADIDTAAMSLAPAGAINSLVQTLLRLTCPGVPDLYQGCDFWDFSLVDPDNRRPVDYSPRLAAMDSEVTPANLVKQWRNGYIKQYLIRKTLAVRGAHPALFSRGHYEPLQVNGTRAERVIAFARRYQNYWLVAVMPRLAANLLGDSDIPLVPPAQWEDTRIALPSALQHQRLVSVFSNHTHQGGAELAVSDLLANFPVNLFCVSIPLDTPQLDIL
ncbi:MAG: malto-oligosyltrehalose synthase [Cellvibrio sp. 79]|nr:MAG: malto-oligosyltrehalose synthase [Cellvibrio sp. 79]